MWQKMCPTLLSLLADLASGSSPVGRPGRSAEHPHLDPRLPGDPPMLPRGEATRQGWDRQSGHPHHPGRVLRADGLQTVDAMSQEVVSVGANEEIMPQSGAHPPRNPHSPSRLRQQAERGRMPANTSLTCSLQLPPSYPRHRWHTPCLLTVPGETGNRSTPGGATRRRMAGEPHPLGAPPLPLRHPGPGSAPGRKAPGPGPWHPPRAAPRPGAPGRSPPPERHRGPGPHP